MRNDKSLQDLVKGCYGRKILYTDVETITADNIVNVVETASEIFITTKPS